MSRADKWIRWIVRRAAAPLPVVPAPVPALAAASAPEPPAVTVPAKRKRTVPAEKIFAAEIANGTVPGIRAVKTAMGVGQDKARDIRASLAELAASNVHLN
jgi:hypothetical protein